MENVLSKLFPPKCLFCKEGTQYICRRCLSECSILNSNECVICGKTSTTGSTHTKCVIFENTLCVTPDSLLSIFEYKGKVREIIRMGKYDPKLFAYLKYLSKYGALQAKLLGYNPDRDALAVPIPSSQQRLKERGYNHADIIAGSVSETFGLRLSRDILIRTRNTDRQYQKTKEERFKNVQGGFCVPKFINLKGQKVLLVDDITTSGATLLEATKALRKAGALQVDCFCISKKLLENHA